MKFVSIKYRADNKTEDVIINLSKIPYVDRTFPNKLNPNQDFEILLNVAGELYRIPFNDKEKADH